METNYIVYRDKEYTTSWISHELADEIANYLTGYLFSCDNVPLGGSEKKRLLRYLNDHDIAWAEKVEISKPNDNIIQIDENLSVTITHVDDEVKATLKKGELKCDLKVEKEDGKLNIYLKGKEFKVLGAKKLGEWMEEVIYNGTRNTVVVFAQDVAPDTVFEDIGTKPLIDNMGATVLIRQYLDFGGRVVWIGDMPFSYQGKNGAKDPEELIKKHKTTYPYGTDLRGASITVLSVIPIFLYAPRRPVEITKRGRNWGLKTVWSSLRPIVIDKKTMELTKYFAKTEGLIASLSIKYKKTGSLNWLKRNFRRIKSFSIGVGEVSVEAVISEDKGKTPKIPPGEDKDKILKNPPPECYEEYASAWFKNFNKEEPNSGFVRIWDFSPRVITKTMKKELLQVATHIINI